MDAAISSDGLRTALASGRPPLVIDVRRQSAFDGASDTLCGALRRDPDQVSEWAGELPASAAVVYCVHGYAVSQGATQALRDRGLDARFLDHGIEGWRQSGGSLQVKPPGGRTRWVTRERPRIDRIACPWLIARFIDRDAEFLYVPIDDIPATARTQAATPYDTAGAAFGHIGEERSFDAFLRGYALVGDPALRKLADIVHAADTGRPELSAESHGLLAISAGLSLLHQDDHVMLRHGMHVYDALYRWCQEPQPDNDIWHLRVFQ